MILETTKRTLKRLYKLNLQDDNKPMYINQPFQTTLADTVQFEDIALHSGRFVHASICPAAAGTGIKFRRMDVEESLQTVPAHADYAEQARLCTRIANADGIGLETIEHFMAAFAGIGLDNAIVEVDAGEAPILDGSSQPIIDAIRRVGLKTLNVRRKYIVITQPVEVQLENGAWARIEPADQLEIDVEIDFEDTAIGKQNLHYIHCDGSFEAELSTARTFCQLSDVDLMQNAGLALGGSLNNAVVVDNGTVVNEGGLRMEREFVRHKALDCLGDLYLLGLQMRGKLTASRPGHALSMMLIKALWQNKQAFQIVSDGAVTSQSEAYVMPELAAAAAV